MLPGGHSWVPEALQRGPWKLLLSYVLAGHCWRTLSTQCIRAWMTQISRTLIARECIPQWVCTQSGTLWVHVICTRDRYICQLHIHASNTPSDLFSYAMPYVHYKYTRSRFFQCSHECINWLVYLWGLRPYRPSLLLAVRSWSSSFSSLNFSCLISKSSYHNSYFTGLLCRLYKIREVKWIITAPALRSTGKVF